MGEIAIFTCNVAKIFAAFLAEDAVDPVRQIPPCLHLPAKIASVETATPKDHIDDGAVGYIKR